MEKQEKQRRLAPLSLVSLYKDPVLIVALGLVFALDQITKAVVRHELLLGESIPRDGTFRITHTFNTGSAFGLFPDQTLFLIVASFVGIGILLLVYRHHPFPGFPLRLSIGMQLGGAFGNLADRLRSGQVTDFVDLSFWPVFNVADASIVIGIIIVAGLFVFVKKEEKKPPVAVYPGYTDSSDVETLPQVLSGRGGSDEGLLTGPEPLVGTPGPLEDPAIGNMPDEERGLPARDVKDSAGEDGKVL